MAEDETVKIPADFRGLSKDEQIDYVQKLWDAIGDVEAMPDWHDEVIRHRLKSKDDRETKEWRDIKERLTDKYS